MNLRGLNSCSASPVALEKTKSPTASTRRALCQRRFYEWTGDSGIIRLRLVAVKDIIYLSKSVGLAFSSELPSINSSVRSFPKYVLNVPLSGLMFAPSPRTTLEIARG